MAPSATLTEPAPAATKTKSTITNALPSLRLKTTVQQQSTMDELADKMATLNTTPILGIDFTRKGKQRRRASTHLMSVGTKETHDILNDSSATNFITGECCGGGCCRLPGNEVLAPNSPSFPAFPLPDNDAFRSLRLKLAPLTAKPKLTGVPPCPPKTIALRPADNVEHISTVDVHPPTYVKPHPPYDVFSAKIHSTRELTKPGAEKKTYHFDLDVTDYPVEEPGVDFRVGGAIGIVAPNNSVTVQEIFERLGIDQKTQDEPIVLETEGGRWPTIWGDEKARNLLTTRRELLTWTVDVQSYAPTKHLLRLMAEYATDETEKMILMYLCSRQGQAAFCELRTGPFVTLIQLLNAFPSSRPELDHLLPVLSPLVPRFYSLSGDPYVSKNRHRRIVEIAVSVHDAPENWRPGRRTGVGSGFFERQARKYLEAKEKGDLETMQNLRVPMFRGLMANPLAKEFISDGPMILIGAGVGIAPFRGFVQRRLLNANCANKVWVLQGIRDSLLDELYSGEWGVEEDKIRKVVESRRGTCRYVQEEVRAQADLVWHVINAQDGRIFVCGSSKGMGEGVEEALIDVAMQKGRLRKEEATEFWKKRAASFQYITETW